MTNILYQRIEINKTWFSSLLFFLVGALVAFVLPMELYIWMNLFECWVIPINLPFNVIQTIFCVQLAVFELCFFDLLRRGNRATAMGFLLFSVPGAAYCVYAFTQAMASICPS
jgi:hypothetical protein